MKLQQETSIEGIQIIEDYENKMKILENVERYNHIWSNDMLNMPEEEFMKIWERTYGIL